MSRLRQSSLRWSPTPTRVWSPGGTYRSSARRSTTAAHATIHYGEALNVGEPLYDVLDADSGELEALHDVFFNDDSLQDKFDGAEGGLLYVASVAVPDLWRQRGADLAVVRRLGDVLGLGCALVVLAPEEQDHQARWTQIGFAPAARQGRGSTYLYLNRSYNHPRVVEVRGENRFEVHPPHDVEVVGD